VWDAGKGDVLDLVARPASMSLADWPVQEPVGLTRSTKLLGFTVVPGYERLLAQLAGLGRVDERGDPGSAGAGGGRGDGALRRQPATFLPDLASSLNNLSVRQSDTGDRTGALTSITEAVTHYRALAAP
jgi:hypothetical protein